MFGKWQFLPRARMREQGVMGQVDAGRGQNVTFDPLYLENFLDLECHRCLMARP